MANDPYWGSTALLLHADVPGDPLWQWCEFADDFTSTFAKKPANTAWNTAGTNAVAYGKNTVTGGYNTLAMTSSTSGTPTTVEFDVYIPSFSQDVNPWFQIANYLSPYNSTPDFALWTNANGTLGGVFHGTTVANITTLTAGRWYHVSVSYNGATLCNVHIDGVLVGSYTVGSTGSGVYFNLNYVGYTSVGQSNRQGNAYYANLRVYRGPGAYKYGPSNYIVAVPQPFLPLFVDASGSSKQSSYVGTSLAALYLADSKFGGCMRFDGASYLELAASADWQFGTGDFTVEAWVKITADSAPDGAGNKSAGVWLNDPGSGQAKMEFLLYGDATRTGQGLLLGLDPGSGWVAVNSAGAISHGVWHHVAVCRAAGVVSFFLDGAYLGGGAFAHSIGLSTNKSRIGGRTGYGTYNYFMNGMIDDLRVTKGVARYTAPFTPPTMAFPEGQTVISGTVRDASGALCSRTVNAHSRATGRLVGTAVSDPVTGGYSIGAAETCYVVVLDSTGDYDALILDRINPVT